MLNSFDWLRRCESGSELLSTLAYLGDNPYFYLDEEEAELGKAHSALHSPCQRCWVYPRSTPDAPYCRFCKVIRAEGANLGHASRQAVLIWGYVNQIPYELYGHGGFDRDLLGTYVHDDHHFLVALRRMKLKDWIQNLILYYGVDLAGLLQIFPTTGSGGRIEMSGVLCSIIHRESSLPLDQLRVRFYATPLDVIKPRRREKKGILTFGITDFLGLLETAMVFRSILYPQEQKILHQILTSKDKAEKKFYWGRFLGTLSQEAKDMLYAWNIRQWPEERVELLYELVNYVYYR